jgi:hypothetical protein
MRSGSQLAGEKQQQQNARLTHNAAFNYMCHAEKNGFAEKSGWADCRFVAPASGCNFSIATDATPPEQLTRGSEKCRSPHQTKYLPSKKL